MEPFHASHRCNNSAFAIIAVAIAAAIAGVRTYERNIRNSDDQFVEIKIICT